VEAIVGRALYTGDVAPEGADWVIEPHALGTVA
jgi:hypothetical protein